jgi:signal transduction histidine kinase
VNAEALPTPLQITTEPFGRRHLQGVWTVWAMGCVTLMVMLPGEETIPYHAGWAGFALALGLGTWNRRQLVTAFTWYTIVTGTVLVRSWLLGHIGLGETAEIPLMFLLALLIAWNVLRRQAALSEVRRLADREVQASQHRERLTRLTSHELRAPLTVARGHVELMQARALVPEDLEGLAVVAKELDRLSRVSDRLIRVIELQDDATSKMVDIDHILAQSLERWRVVPDRRWVLDADVGNAVVSPERLRTCIDTLVENAIRYTSVGDTIRLVGSRRRQYIVLGVLDSGAGLTEQQVIAINAHEQSPRPGTTGGTNTTVAGLGLSIVREIARARGGALYALHAPEGGAALTIALPLLPPDDVMRSSVPLVNAECQHTA